MLIHNCTKVEGTLTWPCGAAQQVISELCTMKGEHKWAGRAWFAEKDMIIQGIEPSFVSKDSCVSVVVRRINGGKSYDNHWFLKLEHE